MNITCSVGGTRHTHVALSEAHECRSRMLSAYRTAGYPVTEAASAPSTRPVEPSHAERASGATPGVKAVAPGNADAAPTERQLGYLKALGADALVLPILTRAQASAYISALRDKVNAVIGPGTAPVAVPAEVVAPEPQPVAAPTYTPAPPPSENDRPRGFATLNIKLIRTIAPGYYAWQSDTSVPLTFVRISVIKSGRAKGALRIATQHGDDFATRLQIYPSHRAYTQQTTFSLRGHQINLEDVLTGILVDPQHTAMLYGTEKRRCSRCNKKLTDARSRHYALGSECITLRPTQVDWVDANHGHAWTDSCEVTCK